MSTYLVSYDLSEPDRDYDKLISFLKSHPYHAHVLESVWCVGSSLTVVGLRDRIMSLIDANDHLIVVEMGLSSAWFNLQPNVSNWLKNSA
ncbi:CRISPR-associated endonuclease Cas2 [Mycobacterium sp. D16R24]|uniref:CRISPR-associated endonuclease Cas2 n=1 Tax=Mycobacterium sp. D16R24 TaxID=1855656 RepID=UPI0009933835|nr:CRISPR-associated endonuclease Cas2 [Mycobacterium sp. D16R24]